MLLHTGPEAVVSTMRSAPQTQPRDSLIVSVLEAMASHERVDVVDLPPLAESINPDALNELFDRTRDPMNATTHVSLEYCGHTVKIYPDHTIIID